MALQGTSHVTGLITGNLVITHKGNLDVHAHDMDVTMRLTFREPGMFSGSKATKHEVPSSLIAGQAACGILWCLKLPRSNLFPGAQYFWPCMLMDAGTSQCLSMYPVSYRPVSTAPCTV